MTTIDDARTTIDAIITVLDGPKVKPQDIAVCVVALKQFRETFLERAFDALEVFYESSDDN